MTIPIVAFKDTSVTFPSGQKRIPDRTRKEARDAAIRAAFEGKESDRKAPGEECRNKKPSSPAELIKIAQGVRGPVRAC